MFRPRSSSPKKCFKNEDGTDFVVPKDDDGNFIYYADNEEEASEAGGNLYNLEEIQTTRGGTGFGRFTW